MRVFDIVFVHDDFLTAIKDIGVHFLNDEPKRVLVTLKNVVKQFKLVQVLLLKHVDAARFLRTHGFSHLGDELVLHNLQHLGLSLRLEPLVRVLLLILQHFLDLVQILGAVPIRIPQVGIVLHLLLRRGQEIALEMIVIDAEITVTLPQENTITSLHRLWLDQAHIYKDLNALFNHTFVDGVASTIAFDLLQDGLRDVNFA